MKDYREMAESVLARRDQYIVERSKRIKKLTAGVSCCCLCALIGAGAWQSGIPGLKRPLDEAPIGAEHGPAADEYSQGVEQKQHTAQENSASEGPSVSPDVELTVGAVPLAPAAADLTQDALYEKMGGFLPDEAPKGFSFGGAIFADHGYSVFWSKGMEELNWRIRDYKESDAQRMTRVADTENYDLALYPIPRADSVPEELRQIVDDPIFRSEELTQAAVNARAYKVNDSGDSDGYRMRFSVLYGDQVISITSKGVSPEWIYDQLSKIPGTFDIPMPDEAGSTGALAPFEEVWGGSCLDDGGNWVVWLTEDTPETRAEVFKRNPSISERGTQFKKADYSLAYLTQLMEDISGAMIARQLPSVSSASLREDRNRIEVSMTDEDAECVAKVRSFDTLGGAVEFRYGISASITDGPMPEKQIG